MTGHAQCNQAVLTSMVLGGVFAKFPTLKVVLIEAGFAWVPSLAWRLDRNWKRLRAETPHLTRLPSEYIRDHVWLTTQPMEEPEPRSHLLDTIAWIGWDRLIFATDYPHWDFDDPATCLPLRLTEEQRRAFFGANARTVYGQG
jgi:predicted TIM-barrel fold metal-dependent hydrolase